jgi:uncharacterized membrane protein YfcA
MNSFFIIITILAIVSANIIGFLTYRKKKNLYSAAFTILLLAFFFGTLGAVLALLIIRDAFAIFYGMQLGYFLIINSLVVFVIAIIASVVRKYSS